MCNRLQYSCKRWSCSTENNRQSDFKKLQETLLTINKKIKFGETWWHKTLSASAISKQVSRCCINFPQELTCRILTNQITKIGCRAWPTRYHGESKVTAFPTSKNWLDFQVRTQFEIKNFIRAAHKHNLFPMHFKKMNLSLRSFGNL